MPNPNGRPKGVREVLPRGVRKTIEIARQAKKLGIEVDEAEGLIIRIMRGDPEVLTRHVGDRLRAAVFILEQKIGKARQRIEVDDQRKDGIYQAEFADGVPVPVAGEPEELPN